MSEQENGTQRSQKVPSSRTGLIAGIAIGLAVAAAGIVGFALRKPSAPPAVATSPAPAVTSTASTAATDASPEMVDLTVKGSPANARIFVDDAAMPENPWHAKYKRGSSHTIQVVAPGYAPRSEQVALSEASTISITLDRQSSSAVAIVPRRAPTPSADKPKESAPPTAATPPAAPTDISLTGGKAPKRSIDPKNPYE